MNIRLAQVEARQQVLLDSIVDYAIISADPTGRILEWNKGAESILGWSRETMLGQTMHTFFTEEDCANGVPEREIGTAISTGSAADNRWHLNAAGERFWATGSMMPLWQGGQLLGVVKILRDITDQVVAEEEEHLRVLQLEKQFQQVAESIPQLVWITDADDQELYFNPRWLAFAGVPNDQLAGHGWHAFIHPDRRDEVVSNRAQAFAQTDVWEDHFQMRGHAGDYRSFLCRALPIRDGDGTIIRWFSTCTDVEGLQQQADGLRQDVRDIQDAKDAQGEVLRVSQMDLKHATRGQAAAEDQVRQLQKMEAVGQLTGGIAHDFNNMLTVIMGSLNMLQVRMQRGDPNVERFVEMALDGTVRASHLTHRLLAFARQQALTPVAVDLNQLITSLSDLLHRTLGNEYRVEIVRHAGLWIAKADVSSLEQAILNLCVNARDAMPDGGRITVETGNVYVDDAYARREEISTGEYVMIAVSDAGTGIDTETLKRVFEPYFTTKEVGRGTGLGLSQVYGFVKQSQGHVKLYSELGHGTTVKIYLPRVIGVSAASERFTLPEGVVPQAIPGESVLVVEDDPRVRLISVEALRELGYEVYEVDSGAAALEVLPTLPELSLIFTDVVMPEMTGRQLADQVSINLPSLPVLYTTGYTRNAIVHNGTLDQGVNLLPKPFTLRELALKVRQVLDA
ncbi:hybrid sensor histidine kinase/response regulator [Pseudomonas oryzihabitans]|uniref:hybrid sensor histidine kinase/response regulator n=1 Tax=Pseudomonas oryzihabitans TaxID=47885 RepID=UPI001643E880|nr:PAS domain-containing sensor histidine kinase [Pseudomonas oryzihabitans]